MNRVTPMGGIDVPGFLEIGNIVKVQYWYGEIVDIAITDNQVIMVQVNSPKAIWRNQRPEWLVYEEGQIIEANIEEAISSMSYYQDRILQMSGNLVEMRGRWIQQLSDS